MSEAPSPPLPFAEPALWFYRLLRALNRPPVPAFHPPSVSGCRLGRLTVTRTLDIYSRVLPHADQEAADPIAA